MNFKTIEDYIKTRDFTQPQNELWICDTVAIAHIEIKKLLTSHFHPQILQSTDIFREIESLFLDDDTISLSAIEQEILIRKIISKTPEFKRLENLPNTIKGLIDLINTIRLYPCYKFKIESETDLNPEIELVRKQAELLLELYRDECANLNFTDIASRKVKMSELEIPNYRNYETIVIYGEFFALSESEWQIIRNYSMANSNQIIFAGSLSPIIEEFFTTNDFNLFQNKLYDYFYSGNKPSLYSESAEAAIVACEKGLSYSVYSDWNDELTHIAHEIKSDCLSNKISLDEIAIYIPEKDLYAFKVEQIFTDCKIPYTQTYSESVSLQPITNFINFFLGIDWNNIAQIFKLLRSPFVKIKYDDLVDTCQLSLFPSDEIPEIKTFDLDWFEEVLTGSYIENIWDNNNIEKKIEGYFTKKTQYEFMKKDDKEKKYKKALDYIPYFKNKIEKIKNLIPLNAKPAEFKERLFHALKELGVETNYIDYDLDEPVIKQEYLVFKKFWSDIIDSMAKIEDAEYNITEYLDYFDIFSSQKYIEKEEKIDGILITELPQISKLSLKRIYMVGLTNKYFPGETAKNAFKYFKTLINPVQIRDTQLFTFAEMLKKYASNKDYEFKLSFPKLIKNEEMEPSEVLLDLNLEHKNITINIDNRIFSDTQKCEAVARFDYISSEEKDKFDKVLHVCNKRQSDSWTEFEGHIGIRNTAPLEKHISISQLEQFAACPMHYFFNYKLKLEPKIKIRKDLEANMKGSLIHKILADYYKKTTKSQLWKQSEFSLISPDSLKTMLATSNYVFKIFENFFDNAYLRELKFEINSGLSGENKKGLLYKVLEYDQKRIEDGWMPSEFEEWFNYEFDNLKFKGIIDRVDVKGDRFDIIDYKTGLTKGLNEIKQGLSFQLPVYAQGYRKKSQKELNCAGYYALKDIDKIKTDFVINEKNKDEVIQTCFGHISTLKNQILNSGYNYTLYDRDDVCIYCDYKTICRYNIEKAENLAGISLTPFDKEGWGDFNKETDNFLIHLNPPLLKEEIKEEGGQTKGDTLTPRQKSALATDKNIIVTAGAGAGKTEVLTRRMLNLIQETKGQIDRILVITFTNKATAEMKNRIYSALADAIRKGEDKNGYCLKAKLNFDKNWISTIDAFYMRILRENAFGLELDAEINISEEQDVRVLIDQTIANKIDEMASDNDANIQKMLTIWSRIQIIEHCNALINLDWIDDFINDPDTIARNYKDVYIKQANNLLIELNEIHGNLSDNTDQYYLQVINIIRICQSELEKVINKFFDYTYNPLLNDLAWPRFSKTVIAKDTHEELKEKVWGENASSVKTFLEIAQFINLEKEYIHALSEILKTIKTEYDARRQEKNIYTFNDISLKLYELLKKDTNARGKLSRKFDFIMVDEFQDTNNIQFEVVKYLAGWDGKTPETIHRNKLFIVGDEKQAIYGFRGGDVQVFNRAKTEIVEINRKNDIDGGFIDFPDNFRSGKNIIEFFNQFFSVVLKNKGNRPKSYEANSQELIGHKADGSIKFFIFNKGKRNDKTKRQNEDTEPKLIASQIKQILNANDKETVAILFRTKKNIHKFAQALQEQNISHVITGGKGFYGNQEILDIYNILSFISDERKLIELTGFLRSPMAGLSDTEIYNLKDDIKEGLKQHHKDLADLIYGWKNLIRELKVYELVNRIICDTLYKTALFKEPDYKQKIKNIERFMEIAKDKENLSLDEFLAFLDFQIENNIDESDAKILELGDNPPVQLMTIHSSKGLGFDTVILADAAAEGAKTAAKTLFYGEIEDAVGNFIGFKIPDPDNFSGKDTVIKNKILQLQKNKEEAELKRLLYVVLTRVKNNLIVSASVFDKIPSGQTFVEHICSYFDGLKERVCFEDDNFLSLELKGIPFYIFNKDCNFRLEQKSYAVTQTRDFTLLPKPEFKPHEIYSYTSLSSRPEVRDTLLPGFSDTESEIQFHWINTIKPVPFLQLDEDAKMKRGSIIHRLLECENLTQQHIYNAIRKELGEKFDDEIYKNYSGHYNNIRSVLASMNIDTAYNELPFLSSDFTGKIDKLIKTKDGMEILDYKVSDALSKETVRKEFSDSYKLQYLIYKEELRKILNIENIRFKVIFSNFGFVELI